jgi:hypothetical protein
MKSNQFSDSNLIPELVTHNQVADGILADLCIYIWICEKGTGEQAAHLHDSYIIMTICYLQTDISVVCIYILP